MKTSIKTILATSMVMALLAGVLLAQSNTEFSFPMVRNAALPAHVLPNAKAQVIIKSIGTVEIMTVVVSGLPANTDFDFFVIQVPTAPFGLSWYQGDVETDGQGNGIQEFIGRFSDETFIVAPGVASAPDTMPNGPFPDATTNPKTAPVQLYHLGMWFNNPADAVKAGAPGTVTPFNGEHNAGVQVINTSNFPALGPLFRVKS
jgi:hypothetical protein